MKIVKYIILTFLFVGCAQTEYVVVNSSKYYPVFETKDFKPVKSIELDFLIKEHNGTKYICLEEEEGLKLIRYTKDIKTNYNTLLKNLNKFNEKVKKLREK